VRDGTIVSHKTCMTYHEALHVAGVDAVSKRAG
jgi:hypothetical protein